MKINILLLLGVLFTQIFSGCMSNNSANTIKIIRAPKPSHVERKQINTGRIEEVKYNSSVFSSSSNNTENINYKMKKSQNSYVAKASTTVDNKVSSDVSYVQNKADTVVDKTIDNALGKVFN